MFFYECDKIFVDSEQNYRCSKFCVSCTPYKLRKGFLLITAPDINFMNLITDSFYFKQQYTIYIYICFNNIYIIITPTCLDTIVSSSGSSRFVHR